ncbi:TPA: NAD-dependent epimerase/dehydratase family protein, partial [Candidatus Woesearchaeota archaeon]|nr:NAD-dependent epimerase/dehydratase family protein [Candidatus Woesearchaeota archaeon]
HISLLKKYDISQVFHFAFVLGEIKDQRLPRAINIGGTRAILEAADQVKSVRRIIFAGSVSAYGARKGNKLYLKETAPLRADTLKYGINKMLMEKEIARLRPRLRDDLSLLMLRICTIVGPTPRTGGSVQTFLSSPFGMSIIGHDCPVQFIHEDDLMVVFDRVLDDGRISGVYNVAPREWTTIKRISKSMKKPILYLPYSLLYGAFWLLFRVKPGLKISENSVSYLSYPIIVDSSRLEKDLGIRFKYSSLHAFLSCARVLQKRMRKRDGVRDGSDKA